MIEALLLAAAAATAWAGLEAHSRAHVRRAEARWPPIGIMRDFDGAQFHIATIGKPDAPPLLLIHGASANLRELWGPLAEPLAQDYRVIAFDRPGYGHSGRPKHAEKLETQARIAADILNAETDQPAIIIAHSLGAAIALRLAIDYPDQVRALLLLAPASHPYPGDNVWWARLGASALFGPPFARWLVPLIGPMRVKGAIANSFAPAQPPPGYAEEAGVGLSMRPRAFRASAADVIASKREFANQSPSYPEIMAPAIIITGDKDRVVSPKIHARALAFELAAAELIIAPGAGHMPHRVRTDLALSAIRRLESLSRRETADYPS